MEARLARIHRRRLPHWRVVGGVYFVTVRLADSLPVEALAVLKEQAVRARNPEDQRRLRAEMERFLDAGHGSCILKRDDCAEIAKRVLANCDSDRYRLGTWAIMPNHLHSIVKPLGVSSLDRIIGDWKSITARQINKVLGRAGTLWQPEVYDSWLRDDNEINRARLYILQNPFKAGLVNWKWTGDPALDEILQRMPV